MSMVSCGDRSHDVSTAGTGFRPAYEAATAQYVALAHETSQKASALHGDQAATLRVYEDLATRIDAVRKQYAAMHAPAKVAAQVATVVRLLSEQVTLLPGVSSTLPRCTWPR